MALKISFKNQYSDITGIKGDVQDFLTHSGLLHHFGRRDEVKDNDVIVIVDRASNEAEISGGSEELTEDIKFFFMPGNDKRP